MSDRPRPDLDTQLDRALEALVADTPPAVDLHERVMAAIDAQPSGRRRIGRFGWGTLGVQRGLLARPVVAMATLAMLVVIVLMAWSNRPREETPRPVTDGGRMTGSAGPRTNRAGMAPRPKQPDGARIPQFAGAASPMGSGPRVARGVRHTRAPMPEPRGTGLPPLETPEPIELEPIAAPPVEVAALSVERLSIEALEVHPLDHSGKE